MIKPTETYRHQGVGDSMNLAPSEALLRPKKEQLVLFAVFTTFLSLLPTGYVAVISNSTTLFADFLRCLGEFIAIVVAWVVLTRMAQNDTRRFNYGYGKLEQLTGVAVAAALFLTFIVSLLTGIRGFISPQEVKNAAPGFVFAILSVLGNSLLWFSNYLSHQRDPSPISESQWRLFRAKTCATSIVALSLGLSFLSSPVALYFDPLGSTILSLFMLWQAYTLVSASVPDLIDYAIEENLQRTLESLLSEHRHLYLNVEGVRSRRTARRVYIELSIAFDERLQFGAVHSATILLRDRVSVAFPSAEVTVIPTVTSQL
jgi:ferrous-iron efflux pump FieF